MESLLIYSAVGDTDVQWQVLDKSGAALATAEQGDLAAAAAKAAGRKLIWVIKGEDVWLGQRTLPSGSRRQLAQALPYTLEEELAADVDGLLFAHTPVGDQTGVAVIDRQLLVAGLARLQQQGLRPSRILPDTLLLPQADDAWYLKQDGERVLVRKGTVDGFVCDRENLPVLLEAALLAAGEEAPARLVLEAASELVADVPGLPMLEKAPERALLSHFSDALGSAPRVDFAALLGSGNLLSRADRKRWLIAAGIAVLALGLLVGERWLALDRLKQHNAELSQAIEQVYRDAFPKAVRVENARIQMEQKLDALRKGSGAGAGFLRSLAGVVKQLGAAEGLKVEGLEYRGELLVLRLQGRDLQQLNGLKQAIEKTGSRTVEIQSVNQLESGVSAQMKIREGRA